jgi:PPM family protein phosphatase
MSDEVDDAQIAEIISQADNVEEAAENLVTAAIDNGGNDNVTVIVISAPADALEKPRSEGV